MLRWWHRLRRSASLPELPAALWASTLADYPFLARHGESTLPRLQTLTRAFLRDKEFHGAGGLEITDAMAVAIAAQACLPLVGLQGPRQGLAWYADFVGVVVHPDAVLANREVVDADGVVHQWQEELSGEAMDQGPVMLSWADVAQAGQSAAQGYNVVIHEFVHKLDMCDGAADGCPPLPAGFLGEPTATRARRRWLDQLEQSYQDFCDKLSLAERFGGAPVWLDPYAAVAIDEFFAVASEAYFVNPALFARDFAPLVPLFDAWFGALTPAA